MQLVGLAIGVVAVIGLVLYLQAQQRRREVAYELALRMGLSPAGHGRSLVMELGSLLGLALVVGSGLAVAAASLTLSRLDPIPTIPPSIGAEVPWAMLAATTGTIAASALAGAAITQYRAGRASIAEVFRVAE